LTHYRAKTATLKRKSPNGDVITGTDHDDVAYYAATAAHQSSIAMVVEDLDLKHCRDRQPVPDISGNKD
jgi:hypothetical protein